VFVFNSFPNNKRLQNSLLLLGVKKRQEIFRERGKRGARCVCLSRRFALRDDVNACSRVVFFFFEVKRKRKFLKNAEREKL